MDLYGSSSDFRIDDLLDFSNDDIFSSSSSSSADTSSFDYCHNHSPMISPMATTATAAAVSANHSFFTSDLCFPSDNDVAELEWLSQFVGDDVDTAANDMSFYGGVSAGSPGVFSNEGSFPARSARSKRAPRPVPGMVASDANSTAGWIPGKSSSSSSRPKRSPSEESPTAARRCTHCLSEKTPQWRSGPMGPKTLCNACGVRFKSGRLVPEYRPAASPTFVLTQHSNSHRKVMELRRQKEIMSRGQQSQQPAEQQGQFYSNHHHHHPHHQHGFRVC